MTGALQEHREEILLGLQQAPNFEVLIVDYPQLVRTPEAWLEKIQTFLGITDATEAMRRVIRQDLYRNRIP